MCLPRSYVESKQGRMRAIFSRLDLDGDGRLDAREVHHAAAGEGARREREPRASDSDGRTAARGCASWDGRCGRVICGAAEQASQGVRRDEYAAALLLPGAGQGPAKAAV